MTKCRPLVEQDYLMDGRLQKRYFGASERLTAAGLAAVMASLWVGTPPVADALP